MKDASTEPIAVGESERAVACVKTNVAELRRKASKARLVGLVAMPFSVVPLFSAVVILGGGMNLASFFRKSALIQPLMLVICVASFMAIGWVLNWAAQRARAFDQQAAKAMHQLLALGGVPSSPVNMSKLPASISSKGIAWRVRLMGLRRVGNAILILCALVIFLCGVSFLFISIPVIASGVDMNRLIYLMLTTGVLGVLTGATCCAILLKSGQRLLEVQESLVEVGAHVARTRAEPGTLELASSFSEEGQLSVGQQAGDLTQARDDERP